MNLYKVVRVRHFETTYYALAENAEQATAYVLDGEAEYGHDDLLPGDGAILSIELIDPATEEEA